MNNIESYYKKGMEHNYIVLKCNSNKVDDYETRMLEENKIKNLLNLSVKESNGMYDYYYETSSSLPISRIYEHRLIGYNAILSILNGICSAIKNGHEYMLSEDKMILSPEYIYMDVESFDIGVINFPQRKTTIRNEFTELAEFFLDKTDHKDNKAVMLAYDLFKTVRNESVNLKNIENLLEKSKGYGSNDELEENERIEEIERMGKKESESFEFNNEPKNFDEFWDEGNDEIDDNYEIEKSDNKVKKKGFLSNIFSSQKKEQNKMGNAYKEYEEEKNMYTPSFSDNYEYDEPYDIQEKSNPSYGKTVLLSEDDLEANSDKGILTYKEGNKTKKIDLKKLPITIGKVESCVDIVIKDSSISRMHATIYEENGLIKIKDLGSTNGTYVNAIMITEEENMPIEKGDEIKLGKLKLLYE